MLAVETHDRIKRGSTEAVQRALKPYYKLRGTKVGEYKAWFDFTTAPPSSEGLVMRSVHYCTVPVTVLSYPVLYWYTSSYRTVRCLENWLRGSAAGSET